MLLERNHIVGEEAV